MADSANDKGGPGPRASGDDGAPKRRRRRRRGSRGRGRRGKRRQQETAEEPRGELAIREQPVEEAAEATEVAGPGIPAAPPDDPAGANEPADEGTPTRKLPVAGADDEHIPEVRQEAEHIATDATVTDDVRDEAECIRLDAGDERPHLVARPLDAPGAEGFVHWRLPEERRHRYILKEIFE
jgi:hypothetical protein